MSHLLRLQELVRPSIRGIALRHALIQEKQTEQEIFISHLQAPIFLINFPIYFGGKFFAVNLSAENTSRQRAPPNVRDSKMQCIIQSSELRSRQTLIGRSLFVPQLIGCRRRGLFSRCRRRRRH